MNENVTLPYLSNEDRIKAYQLILTGCSHFWSKAKLQTDKVIPVLEQLIQLAQNDPYFLAHLTAYASKLDSKDLKVSTVYVNALSSADGQPFSKGSKYTKPNLRYVSYALLQALDPKMAYRVRLLGMQKFGVKDVLNVATHFPTALNTAFQKYLRYREQNIQTVKGIKKAGLGQTYRGLYILSHLAPSDSVASILRWKQRGKELVFETPLSFKDLTDLEIAEKIRSEKISPLVITGLLKKMSPVIAVAMLEQCTGNQAVIYRSMLEEQGILNDPEVLKLYQEKIQSAKTALDRAEGASKTASEKIKQLLKETRAEQRQEATVGLGKVYLHLDASGSMSQVFENAVKMATIFAECVNNPKDNFRWGYFGSGGMALPLPEEFVEDAFKQILFGRKADAGSTNVFALYPTARKCGAEVDVYVTDEGHNEGDLRLQIENYHKKSELPKPKAVVIVKMDSFDRCHTVQESFEANGVPVAVIKPEALTNSALVVQTVMEAMKGPMAVIDNIMETPLPELPSWYYTV